jgi:hypothetical protein
MYFYVILYDYLHFTLGLYTLNYYKQSMFYVNH